MLTNKLEIGKKFILKIALAYCGGSSKEVVYGGWGALTLKDSPGERVRGWIERVSHESVLGAQRVSLKYVCCW